MFDEIRKLQREIDRIFQNFWGREDFQNLEIGMRTALYDLEETNNEVIARFEIPGVDKKDIQLTVTDNSIEVKAEKKQEAKTEKKEFKSEKRSYKGFYKRIVLPTTVNSEETKAEYKEGILEIKVPKKEKAKKKKIEVN